jgi:predicted transcriptional regulator
MDQQIGRRLYAIRARLGVSQRQLARVSGVANATISQIEAGKLNPFRSDQPHQFRNVGNVTCELISACTPPSF